MTNTTTKNYRVGLIQRAIVYYKVEAQDARTAAENWQDGEFSDCDDDAIETEGPCSVREQQRDGSWRKVPKSLWQPFLPETEDDRLRQLSPDLLALARQIVLAKDTEEGVPADIYHAAVRIIARIEGDQA
jgi:hypothetical protein